MPAMLIGYLATVLLVPSRTGSKTGHSYDRAFRRAMRSDPVQTLGEVRRTYQGLDGRLARLERYVTSSRFKLDQEFKRL